MAVNARTFQILYIVRQRALTDLPTTMDDILSFIACRRRDAPDIYHRAYIAPSALVPLLHRMTTGEGLLMVEPTTSEYQLSTRGSQMADLLDGTDACGNSFLEFYKEEVCLAVLKQRQRLNQPPANPREIAALANISLDSARRGLTALVENLQIVEDRTMRTPTYMRPDFRASAPPVAPVDPPPDFVTDGQDGDVTTPGGLELRVVTEADIEKAARIPLDDEVDISDVLADIDEDDDEWATAGPPPKELVDPEDLLSLPLGRILGEEDVEETVEKTEPSSDPFDFTPPKVEADSEPEEADEDDDGAIEADEYGPYDWTGVTLDNRDQLVAQAQACGLSLNHFLEILNRQHKDKVQRALLNAVILTDF
jgi:hypothetical protein